jgi:UDP-N-acetylglucosamine 1-carboxyvinyltransferase
MATTLVPSRRGTSRKFVITGGSRLAGEYPVQGNKNAALPLICAALLARAPVLLRQVPRIDDVDNLLLLVQALGVEVEWQGEELILDSSKLEPNELPAQLVERLRGAILLLGPLAASFDHISCALPGGCPIGRRSFEVHWRVFQAAGYSVDEGPGKIELNRTAQVREPSVYLEESSVTATENALLLFSALGAGTIENPAREPHVFSLIEFLNLMGCEIELHPLYFRVVRGIANKLKVTVTTTM